MRRRPLARRAFAGAAWTSGQTLVNQGVRFAAFVLLARLLGPEAFGLIALALGVVLVGHFLTIEGGWIEALVRRSEADPADEDAVFWTLAAASVLAAAVVALAAPVFAGWWGEPELARVLPWMAPLFPLYSACVVPRAKLMRAMEFRALALASSLATAAGAASGVAAALAGAGLWSLVVYPLVQQSAEAVALWRLAAWRPGLSVSPRRVGRLLGFVRHVLVARCGSVVDVVAGRSALGAAAGQAEAVGYYAFALDLHGHMRRLLVMPMTRVALPAVAGLRDQPERLRRAVLQGVRVFCLAAFPAPIGLALVAPDLVPLLFGPDWAPAIPALQLAMLLSPAAAFTRLSGTLQLATGHARSAARLSILASLVFGGALLLLPKITPETVLLTLVVRSYALLPLHLRAVVVATGVDARRLAAALAQVAAALLVMAVVVWAARGTTLRDLDPLLRLLVVPPLGAAAYGLALLLCARRVVADAWDLISGLRGRRRLAT